MPPNLGGFFMVRSYYPSECHADYFDFERIEALKPAIEACGISTLSQSPMLGFHKQMDNRIKLLEEILSFRMQGVEFDNGDMYVHGHKAASDVRDEFVSVTEKLMDELAQCYNVLPQLDINNTIDHRPEDRKSGSAGMPRPISYAVFCLKKKNIAEPKSERDNSIRVILVRRVDQHHAIHSTHFTSVDACADN